MANSVFWMARYIERAENLARFVEVTLSFSLDQPDNTVDQWEPLVKATGDEEYFLETYKEFSTENVLQFLTFDRDYAGSIQTAVAAARENARTIREAISSEAWEQLNTLHHFVLNASRSGMYIRDAAFYDEIVQHCYMFTGIMHATMTRGTGWHFANIGRFLERADKTSRILDVKYFTLLRSVQDVDTPFDDLLWSAVLRSTCGLEMFRKRYRVITVPRIVNFLILNDRFPRAIRFSVEQARDSLMSVAGPVPDDENQSLFQAERIVDDLRAADAESIINGGMHEFIDALQNALNSLGDSINNTYFSERPLPKQQQTQQ